MTKLVAILFPEINNLYMQAAFTSNFYEVQKFSKQRWIWVLTSSIGMFIIGLFGYAFYKQIIKGEKFGTNPLTDHGLIITSVLVVVFTAFLFYLLLSSKLVTQIDNKGINYQFYPFHRKLHTISWDSIDHYNVVSYQPIREFGGWGFRYFRRKSAYNVSGKEGLQVILKNGKKLLIGTQKGRELSNFLARMQ